MINERHTDMEDGRTSERNEKRSSCAKWTASHAHCKEWSGEVHDACLLPSRSEGTMSSNILLSTPSPSPRRQNFFENDSDDDAVSQRSISLSSPTTSVQPSAAGHPEDWTVKASTSNTNTIPAEVHAFDYGRMDASVSSTNTTSTQLVERKDEAATAFTRPSSQSSSLPSPSNSDENKAEIKYPPKPFRMDSDASSTASFSSSSSRKERPESCLMELPNGPLVPGVALVDFNHLVRTMSDHVEATVSSRMS